MHSIKKMNLLKLKSKSRRVIKMECECDSVKKLVDIINYLYSVNIREYIIMKNHAKDHVVKILKQSVEILTTRLTPTPAKAGQGSIL